MNARSALPVLLISAARDWNAAMAMAPLVLKEVSAILPLAFKFALKKTIRETQL